jgi:hypothetical protein
MHTVTMAAGQLTSTDILSPQVLDSSSQVSAGKTHSPSDSKAVIAPPQAASRADRGPPAL